MTADAAVELAYSRQGQGPYVTMLHALGADRSIFAAQLAALAPHYSVLLPDLRGHGASPAPAGPYHLSGMAADIVALWDRLGVASSHVVGISLGGFIAQHLAIEHPTRVERLVLADTTAAYPPEAAAVWPQRIRSVLAGGTAPLVEATLQRWFTEDFRRREPAAVAALGELIARCSRQAYAACCEAIAALDTRARLGQIGAPTLVLVGEQDTGTPPQMAESLAQGIRGARLQRLADAAHLSCVEQGAAFSAALRAFLDAAAQ